MSQNNHINYTAADIQRYLQGKMTPQEMHALEKAALDDEFLADAIEGFALVEGEEHDKILGELKESLASKSSTGKVVEMKKGGWKQWYRIAAALFILLGSAAILYKYVFNEKPGDLQQTVAKQETTTPATATTPANIDTIQSLADNNEVKTGQPESSRVKKETGKEDVALLSEKTTKPAAISGEENSRSEIKEDVKDQVATVQETEKKEALKPTERKAVSLDYAMAKSAAPSMVTKETPVSNAKQYLFKGRVVNSSNEPLAFTKISIVNDSNKIGTFADAKGYFNFIAPDSVLSVEAKYVGFATENVLLKSGAQTENKLVLKESNQALSEVVITSAGANRQKAARTSIKDSVEWLEPLDGWSNYDTYIVNNIEIPEHLKKKNLHGDVELSFTVDKNGSPQNISVERSLDKKADEEAIRLLKDGPKWKAKKRKAKGKVTVRF